MIGRIPLRASTPPQVAPRAPAVRAEFPSALSFLFERARYKVAYGGRGSAKSWSFARAALLRGANQPQQIVCCREIQRSIEQSVYQLLCNQIPLLGLSDFYQVYSTEIRGANGTKIIFAGLRHNIDNLKSLEGADLVWVEEAQTVSLSSWRKLTPTVRKEGSEIWISFNPDLDTDPTYQEFVVRPPTGAIVKHVTFRDNPWMTPELEQERLDLLARDPDAYQHVWEGQTVQHLEGAIYANELRDAAKDGRITKVPYDRRKGVHVYVDLGWGDNTSLWFEQRIGMEHHFLRSYQNRQKLWQHYLKYIQELEYVIECIWLPHDAESGNIAGLSIARQTQQSGFPYRVIPNARNAVRLGIDAARSVFNRCYFDEELCADGLQALRRYKYKVDEDGRISKEPAHDDASHYADAFRYFAVADVSPLPTVNVQEVHARLEVPSTFSVEVGSAGLSWMQS